MVQSPATWVAEFFNQRELNGPDGRVLYAYRCTTDEFNSLAEALSNGTLGGAPTASRAFVLYAAEWWQRKYDGAIGLGNRCWSLSTGARFTIPISISPCARHYAGGSSIPCA